MDICVDCGLWILFYFNSLGNIKKEAVLSLYKNLVKAEAG